MDKIILIILLVVAVVLGIIFSMVFYNRGKQKIEDKYEKLGKDASKIIDDAEKEGRESEYQYTIHFDEIEGYLIKSEGVPEKE